MRRCSHIWIRIVWHGSDDISSRGLGANDGSAAYEGAYYRSLAIGRWQWDILADAMDHQGCLSELIGEDGVDGVKKGAMSSDDPWLPMTPKHM